VAAQKVGRLRHPPVGLHKHQRSAGLERLRKVPSIALRHTQPQERTYQTASERPGGRAAQDPGQRTAGGHRAEARDVARGALARRVSETTGSGRGRIRRLRSAPQREPDLVPTEASAL
jgi:hypothetical protein